MNALEIHSFSFLRPLVSPSLIDSLFLLGSSKVWQGGEGDGNGGNGFKLYMRREIEVKHIHQ